MLGEGFRGLGTVVKTPSGQDFAAGGRSAALALCRKQSLGGEDFNLLF